MKCYKCVEFGHRSNKYPKRKLYVQVNFAEDQEEERKLCN